MNFKHLVFYADLTHNALELNCKHFEINNGLTYYTLVKFQGFVLSVILTQIDTVGLQHLFSTIQLTLVAIVKFFVMQSSELTDLESLASNRDDFSKYFWGPS